LCRGLERCKLVIEQIWGEGEGQRAQRRGQWRAYSSRQEGCTAGGGRRKGIWDEEMT